MNKGFITDLIYVGVLLFFFAVMILLSFNFLSGWHNQLNKSGLSNQAETSVYNSFSIFDTLFALFFVGLVLALFASVFMLNTHPVFFVAVFLVWVLMIIFSVVFANSFESLGTSSEMIDTAQSFPMTMFIMKNLPKELSVIGGVVLILMFGKRKLSGGGL